MYEKLFARLTRYANKNGHSDLAHDLCQWVIIKHLSHPQSGYLVKPSRFLLTDFLREWNGGGRIIDSPENEFAQIKGLELKRTQTIPGLRGYYPIDRSLDEGGYEERFAADNIDIDKRIFWITAFNKIKLIIRSSDKFSNVEKRLFELLLLDFSQNELAVEFGVSPSRISQMITRLNNKVTPILVALEILEIRQQ